MLRKLLIALVFFLSSWTAFAQEHAIPYAGALPLDVLTEIFSFLDKKQAIQVSQICKYWNKAVNRTSEFKFNHYKDSYKDLMTESLQDSTLSYKVLVSLISSSSLSFSTFFDLLNKDIQKALPSIFPHGFWPHDSLTCYPITILPENKFNESIQGFSKEMLRTFPNWGDRIAAVQSILQGSLNRTPFWRPLSFIPVLPIPSSKLEEKMDTLKPIWDFITLSERCNTSKTVNLTYDKTFPFLKLINLPRSLYRLEASKVDLSGHALQVIPWGIDWQNVQELSLSGNLLETFPSAVTGCSNLTMLDLSHNGIKGPLPTAIGNLVNLKILKLNNNQITSLPLSLSRLVALTELDCSHNQMRQFPTAVTQCSNLRKLDLSHNNTEENAAPWVIPNSFGNLTKLQVLKLNNNAIEKLPETISRLTAMKELDCSDCRITTKFPLAVTKCTSLIKLYLNDNQMNEDIPSKIGQLCNLKELKLNNNCFKSVPISLTGVIGLPNSGLARSLDVCDLSGNQYEIKNKKKANLALDIYQRPLGNLLYRTYEECKTPALIIAALAGAAGLYYGYKKYRAYRAQQAEQQHQEALALAKRKKEERMAASVEELLNGLS